MNQALLTRLFKSIDGNRNKALIKVAYSIIEEKKRLGHNKLADKLTVILDNKIEKIKNGEQSLKPIKEKDFKVPVDRRYRLPLATHIERNYLRHHMVLSKDVENKILRVEKEYLSKERLSHYGLHPRRKILLYGPSGCGKSMAAERIAWDLGLPFYKVRFDSIISSYFGESASNLNSLLDSVNNFPCVLLLDEFDIIGKQREANSKDVGEVHRIVNILLGLLEDYDGDGLVIATTNLEESLDKALFRRFDDIIYFPKPTFREIEQLLKNKFSSLNISQKLNLSKLSKELEGFSYALIVKIANDAAKNAVINSLKTISDKDLLMAINENKVAVK